MTLAILCSGQGAQRADMFDLTGAAPQADALFAHAGGLLGDDPRTWVRQAGPDALRENRAAQILCTVQALAAAALLEAAWPRRRCVAGYSVGEVASWSVAGIVDPHDALDLAAARAQAMDAASDGDERMAFVRGLSRAQLAQLCDDREAAIAIANPGDAFVVAGTQADVDAVANDAVHAGAQRVAPVCVRIASHTRRLAAAVPVFRASLAALRVRRPLPGTRLFSGIDGASVLDVDAGLDKLARQIAEPVEWAACLAACVEAGATAFLELGPGRALADMASGAYPALPARSLADFRSVDGVTGWLARVAAG
ncbi:malonate decarboxylase subunit epsilon [Burkholderia pseudomultivorans]|uniref:Malonyl CoA-acyl carrier protein transacylase n=1 Tax=Burkholderia pseudomultivorans TaxID=1207504 RepID=A0ABU2DWH6_9BURK|nr:malonate decarboxylase subunit epsilon [Burkholderia pseudomultivorans]MDR8727676.1 Malonyl CoA-acyl carrier protein transacylase [Burkholderia pseudomultivorans]MDR8734656.1 Malonyl CoA-acyl carrier protein transacylase [Burkholderia pseudomultivorans]MDR8740622.1 Malonyl CoA-acyl carrier protein transacylase [Burkholderia pseudomultivorans]MDR8751713.1 Malonyl CoA-acyl carrier protein transacylase [Burkholderia pseudomultivorans]MDR8777036.1 Malonyl CoA-acyl carrier protein transacylase [